MCVRSNVKNSHSHIGSPLWNPDPETFGECVTYWTLFSVVVVDPELNTETFYLILVAEKGSTTFLISLTPWTPPKLLPPNTCESRRKSITQ